ncbi:hypothetical protein PORY_001142 [Pneumocystis oryctolagi]|uniref:Uncharacterized protein n=1 Tax=Pneumocystis oryctolagi TaxID=42067 RepID=A0ACB7CD73_9ASCO|nr:hypothetical protein PORY_001142 [Pneumocystis oryctolagi]
MSIFYAGIARGQEILSEYSVDGVDMSYLVSLILEKVELSGETKLTYVYKMYMIHYICTPMSQVGGMTYLCITSDQIGRRISFSLLYEMKHDFLKRFSLHDIVELPVSEFSCFNQEIAEKIRVMMNSEDMAMTTDMARVVKKEIEHVKIAMVENIERVLERGERIELLLDRTQNMNETAFSFSKRSCYLRNKNQHHRQVWWKYVSMLRQKLRQYFLLPLYFHEKQQIKILMLIPNAYLYFSSIIAQGQFPKLGLVLVTIVASIRDIFWKDEVFQENVQETDSEDLGEVVNLSKMVHKNIIQ